MGDFKEEYYKRYGIKIQNSNIVPLFYTEYWDGPLVIIFKCLDKHYYGCLSDDGPPEYGIEKNTWHLIEMTPEETELVLFRNKLFCEYVGEHTNYYWDEQEVCWLRRADTVVKSREMQSGFYSLTLPKLDEEKILNREVFGSFCMENY